MAIWKLFKSTFKIVTRFGSEDNFALVLLAPECFLPNAKKSGSYQDLTTIIWIRNFYLKLELFTKDYYY